MKFGCDEAGRGPVLGSMFVSCVYGGLDSVPQGVQDSKNLSNERIHRLADEIQDSKLQSTTIEISVSDIDNKKSMTDLSAKGFARSIKDSNLSSCNGYIDCFANDENKAQEYVQNYLVNDSINVVAEFKADEKYPLVSAASIVAKSEREHHVEELKSEYGDVGSGYPSDQTTRGFLRDYVENNGSLPDCARRSWSTSTDILEKFN